MRRFMRLVRLAQVVGLLAAALAWWRRHPRFGTSLVNRVVDPWLVRTGALEASRGELGLLEHVGRKSGLRRVTPVHPVATDDGYRIIVPLGTESQWARNVLAAEGCRLQVGEPVHRLSEPVLVAPSSVDGVPRPVAAAMSWLGFRYLVVKRVGVDAGTLEAPIVSPASPARRARRPVRAGSGPTARATAGARRSAGTRRGGSRGSPRPSTVPAA